MADKPLYRYVKFIRLPSHDLWRLQPGHTIPVRPESAGGATMALVSHTGVFLVKGRRHYELEVPDGQFR